MSADFIERRVTEQIDYGVTEKNERRVTERVHKYWAKKVGKDEKYPREEDIDIDEIIEMLPYCVIIRIHETKDKIEYEFSHIGGKVKEFYQEKIFTDPLIPFVSPIIETFKDRLEELLETQVPIKEMSETINMNQEIIKFRQCFLPLAEDGKKITGALCAVTCKLF